MASRKARRRKKKRGPKRPQPAKDSPARFRPRWGLVILGVLIVAVGVYIYDYQGPLETISGQVSRTRSYPHQTTTEPLHQHTEAVIEFEGTSHTVAQADGVRTGDRVSVVVKRGRLSGRPRYVAFRRLASTGS